MTFYVKIFDTNGKLVCYASRKTKEEAISYASGLPKCVTTEITYESPNHNPY